MRSLIVILSVLFLAPLFIKGAQIRVGTGEAYKSIQLAINAAQPYDTIHINKGLYKEGNIQITKPLTIIGKGWPEIDGEKKYEVFTIKANDVIIRGLKVQHSGYATLDDPGGIKVLESQNVVIENNWLFDNFFGVYLQYSKNCIVRGNRIQAYGKQEQEIGNGIHCWKSDSLIIENNFIKGHRDGIYFEFVHYSSIHTNHAVSNIRYGLHFMFSNNDVYTENKFQGNGAGVAVMYSRSVDMYKNIFYENWGDAAYGLLLKEISDGHISGNQFTRNTVGVFMEGTNRMKVEKNKFDYNGWAMKIQASCMENEIKQNNFLANTFDVSTNGTTVLNTFLHNYWDKYSGYDLNKDGIGDVPYRPLTMFGVLVEKVPAAMLLFRSFMVLLLDQSEKIFPTLTPDHFIDPKPSMKYV
ncbi:MAG: nitrous oxide reductase family maturation protein NosD [Sediminibacterium sp.]|jgi:nitrous oxidase accessory protein|nr:nitrous oxide reductase family maturation protein NosD [Hydrotalea sp.]MCU0336243.1 nitrous oxide reductase family maturation protein NosD [Sediminibacterium sp.]